MGKSLTSLSTTLCLLLLALTLGLATSARLLDEFDPTTDLPALPPIEGPTTALPSGQAPAAAVAPPADEDDTPAPDEPIAPVAGPASSSASTAVSTGPAQGAAGAGAGAAAGSGPEHPALSFYMHDVLGGSHASGRIVTGIIATTDVNGIPFSRPNNQMFPGGNGVPLVNSNVNNLINNNNAPYLASLNGQQNNQQQTVIQNTGTNTVVNGNNNNNNQAFVSPGQLPSGVTLQKLMFGSITVIDDELTEGHELGSAVMGKGQGFYLASSLDGESHTMAFTALFHGGDDHEHGDDDTISFFGVHRTASPISQLSVIGGTGKYEHATGYATIETLPQEDQHTTDGVDTIAHINVFLY